MNFLISNALSADAQERRDTIVALKLAKHKKTGSEDRARVLRNIARMQKKILVMCKSEDMGPGLSTNYINWLTDLNTFILDIAGDENADFPYQQEEPAHYGEPASLAYIEHWVSETEMKKRGPTKVTLPSNLELTPLSERVRIWEAFQPAGREPDKGYQAGELALPASRDMALCLADPSDHAKVEEALGKVSRLIGPEFVLFCTLSARYQPIFTLGVRPNIDIDIGVIYRYSRVWWDLLAWWIALNTSNSNLVEFLEDRYRHRLRAGHLHLQEIADREREKADAIAEEKHRETLARLSAGSDDVPVDRLFELHSAAVEELTRRAALVVERLEQEHQEDEYKVQKAWINQFVDDGHESVHLVDKSQRAQLVTRAAEAQLEQYVDSVITERDLDESTITEFFVEFVKTDSEEFGFLGFQSRLDISTRLLQRLLAAKNVSLEDIAAHQEVLRSLEGGSVEKNDAEEEDLEKERAEEEGAEEEDLDEEDLDEEDLDEEDLDEEDLDEEDLDEKEQPPKSQWGETLFYGDEDPIEDSTEDIFRDLAQATSELDLGQGSTSSPEYNPW